MSHSTVTYCAQCERTTQALLTVSGEQLKWKALLEYKELECAQLEAECKALKAAQVETDRRLAELLAQVYRLGDADAIKPKQRPRCKDCRNPRDPRYELCRPCMARKAKMFTHMMNVREFVPRGEHKDNIIAPAPIQHVESPIEIPEGTTLHVLPEMTAELVSSAGDPNHELPDMDYRHESRVPSGVV